MLSKQELKTFLTIYQLEDEGKMANYGVISQIMGVSTNCIRTYIHSLMKKNAPIIKNRLNNKITILSINKDFRTLSLKKRLVSLFYERDPDQTTLLDIN